MNPRFFNVSRCVAPLVLTPLAYWAWLAAGKGDHRYALSMVAVPVLFAYIMPAVGINVLRIWKINTRLRLGRFRPNHGFVFGSSAACIAWLALPPFDDASMGSYAQGGGPDAIAMDYAPPIFGMFGVGHGACAACIVLCVGGYIAWSYWRFGENGLRSHESARGVMS